MIRKLLFLVLFTVFFSCKTEMKVKSSDAEIACGQCQFEMKDPKGCDLAIRVLDKPYFVDGYGIDDFGDAHDKETGFCEVIRKAKVEGIIENGRFFATSIELVD